MNKQSSFLFFVILGLMLNVVSCAGGVGGIVPTSDRESEPKPVYISNGDYHICVLSSDGSVDCWVFDDEFDYGQGEAPASQFESISSGDVTTCGIDDRRQVQCWGGTPGLDMTPPGLEDVRQVSVGDYHACALAQEGNVVCWGSNDFGQATTPDKQFEEISAGRRHTCGLLESGRIECWGVGDGEMLWDYGQTAPPDEEFKHVQTGTFHSCGITVGGSIECWGLNDVGQSDTPSGDDFVEIAVGVFHTCALSATGKVDCWGVRQGMMDFGQSKAPEGKFRSIAGRPHFHGCGVTDGGEIKCWGKFYGHSDAIEERELRNGDFESVHAGFNTSCAIERGTRLAYCWGFQDSYLNIAPRGRFHDIGVVAYEFCGVDDDGVLACRGRDPFTRPHRRDDRSFRQVSGGSSNSCGLYGDDMQIACWSIPGLHDSEETPDLDEPPGEFQYLDVGLEHACGVDAENSVLCWGNNKFGQTEAPSGEFTIVSAGSRVSCGVTKESTLECWGGEDESTHKYVMSAIPSGAFQQVAVASLHACALDTERQIQCWGEDSFGMLEPPEGEFKDLSMGSIARNACAIRTNGEVVCWGMGYGGWDLSGVFLMGQTPRF